MHVNNPNYIEQEEKQIEHQIEHPTIDTWILAQDRDNNNLYLSDGKLKKLCDRLKLDTTDNRQENVEELRMYLDKRNPIAENIKDAIRNNNLKKNTKLNVLLENILPSDHQHTTRQNKTKVSENTRSSKKK